VIFLPAFVLLAAAGQQARTVAARTEVSQVEPGVKRTAMQVVEKSFDARLESTNPPDPFDPLGNARGLYLPGFGVVLTAEIDLIKVPGISPFHQKITAEERPRLRARKLAALPRLKEAMKAAMISAAQDLRSVPLNENIVVGVSLFYFVGEDSTGLPLQVVMQATRQQLLTNQGAGSIKVQEF
jgi:hypothetical protein